MIKVHIDNPAYSDECRLWIIDESENRAILRFDGKLWHRDKIKDGESQTPSLTLPYRISNEVMKAMSDAFFNQGIRPDSNAILEGELKATKIHLSDLRQLVFKKELSEHEK